MMKRIHLLFAALLVAAIAVPGASAQTVHFAGLFISCHVSGFMVAAYNDLATDIVTANPGFTIHSLDQEVFHRPRDLGRGCR